MKKLLYIKDSEEFWKIFTEEREKRRKRLRRLPFGEKIKIVARMQKIFDSYGTHRGDVGGGNLQRGEDGITISLEEAALKVERREDSETLPRTVFEAEIQKITDQLIRIYKPEKIILFGSLAGGEIHSGSDIDLFIIKRDVPELGVNRIRQLDSLIKYKLATDFIVYRPDEVESSLKMGDPFVEYVLQQGRILYSAS